MWAGEYLEDDNTLDDILSSFELDYPIEMEYFDETPKEEVLVPLPNGSRVSCPMDRDTCHSEAYGKILDMQFQGEVNR